MNKLTKLQELTKNIFTVANEPINIEEITSFPFSLPEQYQEFLLIANGGGVKSKALIMEESIYLSDTLDSFTDLGSTIQMRNGIIDYIKEWELPFSIDQFSKMLPIGESSSLVGLKIMIGIIPENWGQIFWVCLSTDFEYYNSKKISNSLYEFLIFLENGTK